jgi:sulfur relay (sulfurtransferase) complex TusBCD TusD component (DsrE family)
MTAAVSGADVALWLSGPATMFAVPGAEPDYDLEHAPDLDTALDVVARVHVCSQCAARRGLTADRLRPGADIAGAATLVESLLADATQALVY